MNITTIKFLLSLKNAVIIKQKEKILKVDSFCLKIVKSLYKEGLIQNYCCLESSTKVKIYFRYYFNSSILQSLKLVSTPSRKIFLKYNTLIFLKNFNKNLFFLTSKGIYSLLKCQNFTQGGLLLFIC